MAAEVTPDAITEYAEQVRETFTAGNLKDAVSLIAAEELEFRKHIPREGFFADYMRYTDRQESPDSYHFWVAATIIGGVIQRRAWIPKGVYSIYAPIYTILVGPSGITRKSRAMSLGTELIQDFEWMNLLADKTTPEALLEAMMVGPSADPNAPVQTGADNTAFIKASELSVFLNKTTYTTGMVALLTDLYDCPSSFRYITRNRKPVILKNVALSFLGASTPEWLATNVPEAAFEGGFMSRVIFVVRNMRNRFIAFPEEAPPNAKKNLQQQILTIRKYFQGPITLSPEARQWFDNWYYEHELASKGHDYNLLGFIERKPDTVLKVALILTAGTDPRSAVVELPALKTAFKLVTWTQNRMFRAFENVDLSHLGGIRQKIKTMLESNPDGVSRRDVMRKLGSRINGTKDLSEVEKVMIEAEEMIVETTMRPGKGRPSVRYRPPRAEERGEDA